MLRRLGSPVGSAPLRYLKLRLGHYSIDTGHFVAEPLPPRTRRTYTREQLQEAAACSRSVREVLEHLGYPPRDSPYGHVRRKLDEFGIDTGHFTGGRRSRPGMIPRDACEAAVVGATSLAGVLRNLGIADGGAARARLRRSLTAHGVDTGHFAGRGHYRGRVSPHRMAAEDILQRREPGANRTKTALLRRALDELGVPHVCAACGVGEVWQGRRLALEIDHTNGDRWDNRRENLRYLCPSCHSQTGTFSRRSRHTGAYGDPVQ
ncbi:HNH endonuclease [Actinacidiphila bryophytorum]|nr:HNH endonuclease [Actinacidiphila bryophytorum]UWE13624.1 HNH endonuclease [Actinacidiphila bryophytorum]